MGKKKPRGPKRARPINFQVWIDAEEQAWLQAVADKRGVAPSKLVRTWIFRTRPRSRKPAKPDPRQITIDSRLKGGTDT